MQQQHQIYQCSVCNTVVEVLRPGTEQQEVCHKPVLVPTKTHDVGEEKHVPVVTKTDTAIHVAVGSVEHPMEASHYIEWIELIGEKKTYRAYLSPGEKPETDFPFITGPYIVRELCTIHGLWETAIV